MKDYINTVVDASSFQIFAANSNKGNDGSSEYMLIQSVFKVMKKLYTTRVPLNTSESTYNHYLVYPLLELVAESICDKTPCGFFPGEIPLVAMKSVEKEQGEKD